MAMSPRMIVGWLYFARRVEKRRLAQQLSIGAMAARGDPKDLKKQIRELEKP
jgi:hypothetical protein